MQIPASLCAIKFLHLILTFYFCFAIATIICDFPEKVTPRFHLVESQEIFNTLPIKQAKFCKGFFEENVFQLFVQNGCEMLLCIFH